MDTGCIILSLVIYPDNLREHQKYWPRSGVGDRGEVTEKYMFLFQRNTEHWKVRVPYTRELLKDLLHRDSFSFSHSQPAWDTPPLG